MHSICLSLIYFKVGNTSKIENLSRVFTTGDLYFFAYQNSLLDKNQITAVKFYIIKLIDIKIRAILPVST
jgi:hypothetical protein